MDSMVAILPSSARSKTSPPVRGRSLTRSPRRIWTPRISKDSTAILSSRSCHSHSFTAPRFSRRAGRATRRAVSSIVLPAELRCAPEFCGGDLGIVVQNYGRREHGVALAFFSYEDWPRADVSTGLGEFAVFIGWVDEGDELAFAHFQNRVGRNEGARERFFTRSQVGIRETRNIGDARGELKHAILQPLRRELDHSCDAGLFAQDYSYDQSAFVANRFSILLHRQAEWPLHRLRAKSREIELRHLDLFFDGFLPLLESLAVNFQSLDVFDGCLANGREIVRRRAEFPDRTRHHAQKSDANSALGLRIA